MRRGRSEKWLSRRRIKDEKVKYKVVALPRLPRKARRKEGLHDKLSRSQKRGVVEKNISPSPPLARSLGWLAGWLLGLLALRSSLGYASSTRV